MYCACERAFAGTWTCGKYGEAFAQNHAGPIAFSPKLSETEDDNMGGSKNGGTQNMDG